MVKGAGPGNPENLGEKPDRRDSIKPLYYLITHPEYPPLLKKVIS